MPSYLSPGVYVEEVDSGSRPIEGVGTAVAAFVGLTERGPFNTPTLVSNWSQFTGTFGEFVPGSFTALSVYGYFMNGGGNCYVVRVGEDGDAPSSGAASRRAPEALLGSVKVVARDEDLRAHGSSGYRVCTTVVIPNGDCVIIVDTLEREEIQQ